MYVYHDEPLPEVSHQEVHDAINGIRNYIESEKFTENIAERILYYCLSSMSYRGEHTKEREEREKVQKEYNDLLERFNIMRSILIKHGLIDEFNGAWMEKEDIKNQMSKAVRMGNQTEHYKLLMGDI